MTERKQLRNDLWIEVQVGDTVYLNSGGPGMTVTKADGVNIDVTWKGKKVYHTAKFNRSCLSVDVPAANTGQ